MTTPSLLRGTGKIVNRPSGGGNKKEGLAPTGTNQMWSYPAGRMRKTKANALLNKRVEYCLSGRATKNAPAGTTCN